MLASRTERLLIRVWLPHQPILEGDAGRAAFPDLPHLMQQASYAAHSLVRRMSELEVATSFGPT